MSRSTLDRPIKNFWLAAGMLDPIVIADAATVKLQPEPIPEEWVLSGTPKGSSKVLARTADWMSTLVVWECTAGRFHWNYSKDETVIVLAGSATIISDQGEERYFESGDVVFFPAGTSCTWLVADRIRKLAVLRETLWRPLSIPLVLWRKLLRGLWWRMNRLRAGRVSEPASGRRGKK